MNKFKPIPFKPLFNDLWVFYLYGVIISYFLHTYASKNASLSDIETLMMEPFSIRAFMLIATSGFIFVTIMALFLGGDEKKVANNRFMQNFCVPISEVGLSAGFIVLGMSLGIMSYYFTLGSEIKGGFELAKANLKIAGMVIFITIPIYWAQRTMLATGKAENFILSTIAFCYIVAVYVILWYSSPTMFWWQLTFTAVLLGISWFGVKLWSRLTYQENGT